MTWVCDIPGATATVSALHLGLHMGLAAFVVCAGIVFLALGFRAYRLDEIVDGRVSRREAD